MLQVGWAPSRVLSVLSRLLIGLVGAVGAAIVGVPGIAAAEPPPDPVPQPPPPPLNVNAFAPVKLSEYAVMDNNWYAFSTPGGDTCVLQKTGSYGCSGALPGAPDGANLVSGSLGAVPGFANTNGPVFGNIGAVKPLPVNQRISYQTVSCGTDGVMTSCLDARNQSGFVIGPGGSFILNESNPLLDRPEGTNPFTN
jgi:hypothetical protein